MVHSDGYRDKSKRDSTEIANTEYFWWVFFHVGIETGVSALSFTDRSLSIAEIK